MECNMKKVLLVIAVVVCTRSAGSFSRMKFYFIGRTGRGYYFAAMMSYLFLYDGPDDTVEWRGPVADYQRYLMLQPLQTMMPVLTFSRYSLWSRAPHPNRNRIDSLHSESHLRQLPRRYLQVDGHPV